jgi:ABC-type uncharacterized transport system permease subunit
MSTGFLFALSALLALVPAAALAWRRIGTPAAAPDGAFWATLAVALAGPLAWTYASVAAGWHTGFSVALWVTISGSMVAFALASALSRQAWKLAPLLLPYLIVLGVAALVWQHAPERPLKTAGHSAWLWSHIAISVGTYALATLAAVAGLGVFLQERALKARRPGALTHHLPSVADGEALLIGLLLAAGGVLLVGVVTGAAIQYLNTGALLRLDHKTVLSLTSLGVIAALLAAHYRTGVRGRRAARYVLLGYLFLTLAYPGVKFVTDVLIG